MNRRSELGAFCTHAAQIGGGGLHTTNAAYLVAYTFESQAATYPAVRTDRLTDDSHQNPSP
jgi:hypothetical protein